DQRQQHQRPHEHARCRRHGRSIPTSERAAAPIEGRARQFCAHAWAWVRVKLPGLVMAPPDEFPSPSPALVSDRRPDYVVAIGASAGGLEAIEQMFRAMPTRTGMAFVVLQHLSPDFKSQMFELMGRWTSLDVHVAEHGMPLVADTVYLIPPG